MVLKGEMDSPEVAASISPLSHQHRGFDDDEYYSVTGGGLGGSGGLRSLSNEELEAELEGVNE